MDREENSSPLITPALSDLAYGTSYERNAVSDRSVLILTGTMSFS